MPDEWTIRPFTPGDQAAARRLIVAGLGEHFGYIDETLNPDLDDIAASYDPERGNVFLIAEMDGVVVGTAALTTEARDSPTGFIVRVSVHPQHRRRGIARVLVERLIALADERKLELLAVETNRDWTAAIRLYEACGFAAYDYDRVSTYLSLDLRERRRFFRTYRRR